MSRVHASRRHLSGLALVSGLLLAMSGCRPSDAPRTLPAPPAAPCPSMAPTVAASAAAPAAPPAPPPAEPAWHQPPHESFTLASQHLGEARRIKLYTPPGYSDSTASFPVLYMLDAGDADDLPHPHLLATVDEAVRSGEVRPVIVVGIENTERRRDMTGPTLVESDRKIAPRVGGSGPFRAFIREELMPEIRRRVRTNGKNAIIGESLAGLFVVETFFVEPGLFDTHIAVSPSLWWNDRALVRASEAWMKAHANVRGTLVLARAGDDDIGESIATLGATLRTSAPRGLTWSYEPRSDLRHATIYEAVAPAVLRRVLSPPAAPPRSRAP